METTVTTTETRPRRNTLAWTVMVLVVALWVFVVFFFDGILSNIAREKLIDLVNSSTHGEYQLSFTSFEYHRGVLTATGSDVRRIAYRATESGTTLKDLGIATTRVTGISWWEIIFGKPIVFSTLETHQPQAHFCSISQGEAQWKLLPPYVAPPPSPSSNISISFDSVFIPNFLIYGQDHISDILSGVFTFNLQNLNYDSKSSSLMHLSAEHFDLNIPWIQYSDSSAHYFVRSLNVTSVDSLLTVDTLAYSSGTSPTAFRVSGVRGEEIGFVRLAAGKGLTLRSLRTRSWGATVTTNHDTTKTPRSTLPWQDQLAHSVSFPIKIDSLNLTGGAIEVHLPKTSLLDARGLNLSAIKFDFDTGAAANQPGFAQALAIAASDVRYNAKSSAAEVKNFSGTIQDSLITVGAAIYYPSGIRKGKSPMEVSDLRIDGISFDSLVSGSAILANSLSARAWKISGLPSGSSSKKSKKTSNSIWAAQREVAKSIGMDIRIGRIDLAGGSVRVASPTIVADGASINAVGFDLDSSSAASKKLFFSRDIGVKASRFQFADKKKLDIVNLRSAHTSLSSRSVFASSAEYLSRSSFEPWINTIAYRLQSMDLRGVDFADLLDNKRIAVATLKASSWAIERSADTTAPPPQPVKTHTSGGWAELITIGHASLPNGTVLFRERDTTPSGYSATLSSKITTLDVTRFQFLPPKGKRPRLAFGQLVLAVPTFSYDPLHGFYTFEIRNLNGDLQKSIITMDSLNYSPKYSEDEFTALHQYARGRTDFRLAPVHIVGIDTKRLIAGQSIDIQDFDAPTVWVDYYKDMRKTPDPNPGPAVLPNDIVRKLNIPITVDTIQIEDGDIQIRERYLNLDSSGNFSFQHVKVSAAPLTLDSASPLVDTPTTFDLSGTFVAQAPMHVTMVYPLHDSSLDLSVDGTVGPFDLKQLNQYLVNAARIQVMSGQFHHADIKVNINGDVANTTALPLYDHFKIKVLPPDPNDPPDLMEGVKTFLANLLILRDDNPDEDGGPPKVGVTSLARQPSQEFFQFLWYAIRKSLGAVVGGMK